MTTPLAATPHPTAGVNVSTTTVITTLLTTLMSAFVGVGAPLLSAVAGATTTHYIAGTLFGLAGIASTIASAWGFIRNNSAASANTVATIENISALAANAAQALAPQPAPPTPIANTAA